MIKSLAVNNRVGRLLSIGVLALTPLALFTPSELSAATTSHELAALTTSKELHLKILHINDHHSMVEGFPLQLPVRNPRSQKIESISVEIGGFGRIKAAVDDIANGIKAMRLPQEHQAQKVSDPELQTQKRPHILKLHAGDALNGSLYYSLLQGRADADLMNSVCFDAMVLGNHEFDEGDLALANFIEVLHSHPTCDTAVLSANLQVGEQSPLRQSSIQAYQLIEKDGHQIAVIGITTALATMYASRPDPGTKLSNELDILRTLIQELKTQGIHHIILLSHLGYAEDKRLAQALPEVDVIVGGRSHTLLGAKSLQEFGLTPQGDYPTELRNLDGDRVCVVQAWQYGAALGELDVVLAADGKVRSCEGQVNLLLAEEFYDKGRLIQGQERQGIVEQLKDTRELRVTAQSPEVLKILQPYQAQVAAFSGEEITVAEQDYCSRRVPGTVLDRMPSRLASCQHN